MTEIYQNVSQAASTLGLNENTFTRYYLDFEEMGYIFKRSSDNKLLFSDDDIEMFREFLVLKNLPKMTKRQAMEQLITPRSLVTVKREDLTTLITTFQQGLQDLQEQNNKKFEELQVGLKELKEENQQKQLYIEESINKRDQLLLESIRSLQEKKKKWWKFW